MWLYLLSLIAGTTAGLVFRKSGWLSKTADIISSWIIYLLLFIMGLRVGTNSEIMDHFDSIGLQALIIALFAIAGSVFLSKITFELFFRHEK